MKKLVIIAFGCFLLNGCLKDEDIRDDPQTVFNEIHNIKPAKIKNPPKAVELKICYDKYPKTFVIEGAGLSIVNGKYVKDGEYNNAPCYQNENGIWLFIRMKNGEWAIDPIKHIGTRFMYMGTRELPGLFAPIEGTFPAPTIKIKDK